MQPVSFKTFSCRCNCMSLCHLKILYQRDKMLIFPLWGATFSVNSSDPMSRSYFISFSILTNIVSCSVQVMIECDGMRRIHVRLVVVHILYPSVDQHHQKSLYTDTEGRICAFSSFILQSCGWWEGRLIARVEQRFCTRVSGVQCARTTSTSSRPQ